MAAPDLTITVEPAESGSVVYGLLAARTSGDQPNGQLSLVLSIKNNEQSQVHLNQVKVSFVGPPNVGSSSIAADLTIPSAQTMKWAFATLNNIILPVPAPGTIALDLICDNFSSPAQVQAPLVQYASPAGGGYSFPAKIADLKQGELWTGLSASHGPAGGGTQLFAYDLLIRAYDAPTNSWPTVPSSADKAVNANYHAWGKPVCAMADGVVQSFKDGMQANTPPGFPNPTPNPVEGNYFYIQHGSDLALYAHLQAGKLNPILTAGPNPNGSGALVTKGQLLGLTGNSGRSSEPHLHIQVNRTTIPWTGPPRPLPFDDMFVLDLTVADQNIWPPSTDSPWNDVTAECLPNVTSAIWPGALLLGKKGFVKWYLVLIWAWIIIIGGLMITPGGIDCIVCGRLLTKVLGIVSIVLGIVGLAWSATRGLSASSGVARPRVEVKGDLHG